MVVLLCVIEYLTLISIETAFMIGYKFLLNAAFGIQDDSSFESWVTVGQLPHNISDFVWLLISMQSTGWLETRNFQQIYLDAMSAGVLSADICEASTPMTLSKLILIFNIFVFWVCNILAKLLGTISIPSKAS